MIRAARSLFAQLRQNSSGVAAVEFALTAPIVLTLFLSGAELTNFTIAKLRVSQIALHAADNASRIGSDSGLSRKTISETQINDLLLGANLQAGTLDLLTRGRVIISSVEPDPTNAAKMLIHWQRCYGQKLYSSPYGTQGTTHLTTIGPVGKQITSVPAGTGVMYVEVSYTYKPLISARLVPATTISDVAAMVVRDDRDFAGNSNAGVFNTEGATVSTCST
jgi:hypothetical protein